MVGFKNSCGSGESIGSHQHHAVGRGQGLHIAAGAFAGDIHESAITRTGAHPGRGFEDNDVIAAGLRGRAEPELRDGEQQQRHADELQDERPGLLDAAAASRRGGILRSHPEAECGDELLAARAVEQIERHGKGRDAGKEGRELEKVQVQEKHEAPFNAEMLRRGVNAEGNVMRCLWCG